jgi:hypothetical protein
LKLRGIYNVGEVARAARVDRRKLRRLFVQANVPVFRIGKLWCVLLSEIETRAPSVWQAVLSMEQHRHVSGK